MDYQRIYNSLIARAVDRIDLNGYKEIHHIKPRSMGGTDDKWNLVKLTAREHFVAHMCLALIYGGIQWSPVAQFKRGNGYVNGRLYAIAKEKIAHNMKGNTRGIGNKSRLGHSLDESTKRKMSISHMGSPKTIGMTGKFHSDETRKKMRDKFINSPSYKQRCQDLKIVNDKRFFESRCIKLNALINSVFA